jgi:hypothetical protein
MSGAMAALIVAIVVSTIERTRPQMSALLSRTDQST